MADFVDELRRSGFAWQLTVVHVPVQGSGADQKIARAIDVLAGDGRSDGVDVIAIVRGGGSRLDLSTFDSEAIGRAIAGPPIPVLTGIGHEIDMSVADVVAHQSFKTPTACAVALVDRVRGSTSSEPNGCGRPSARPRPRSSARLIERCGPTVARVAWLTGHSARRDRCGQCRQGVAANRSTRARQQVADTPTTRVARLAGQLARRPSRRSRPGRARARHRRSRRARRRSVPTHAARLVDHPYRGR